jgi:hypothetical protein
VCGEVADRRPGNLSDDGSHSDVSSFGAFEEGVNPRMALYWRNLSRGRRSICRVRKRKKGNYEAFYTVEGELQSGHASKCELPWGTCGGLGSVGEWADAADYRWKGSSGVIRLNA